MLWFEYITTYYICNRQPLSAIVILTINYFIMIVQKSLIDKPFLPKHGKVFCSKNHAKEFRSKSKHRWWKSVSSVNVYIIIYEFAILLKCYVLLYFISVIIIFWRQIKKYSYKQRYSWFCLQIFSAYLMWWVIIWFQSNQLLGKLLPIMLLMNPETQPSLKVCESFSVSMIDVSIFSSNAQVCSEKLFDEMEKTQSAAAGRLL